ncbi:MAG: antitoxin family protein [Pyrinomonadaceae bacterium]
MSRTIQAIYENGLFRPLSAVDLPENSLVEIDWQLAESGENSRRKISALFRAAGLSRPIHLDTGKSDLTEERRTKLSEIFSAETPLGDYIDDDREDRG